MTQEELVAGLKERVGNSSFQDRTFEDVAKNALPLFADDSKVSDETWNIPVSIMKTINGQFSAEVASTINSEKERINAENKQAQEKWQKDFSAKWEREHSKAKAVNAARKADNEPVKTETGSEDDRIAKAVDAAMKAQSVKLFGEDGNGGILGKIGDFMRQTQQQTKEAKMRSMREDLKQYLIERGASTAREPLINLTVKQIELDENSDIDKAKLDVEKLYQKNYKSFYGDGGKPFGGSSAGAAGGPDENLKKYLQDKAEKTHAEAESAESLRKKFR